jgi:hypothetical protein
VRGPAMATTSLNAAARSSVTHGAPGWGFTRTMTLAEGYEKCNFWLGRGGETERGWPPPLLSEG